jgi:magnesium chelatase subunit I
LGALRDAVTAGRVPRRSVRDELRDNLVTKLRAGTPIFPGIIGYDDTVVPQLVNAILSRHNFILLGLRGQAKTRLLRALSGLLDEQIPVVPGCEIHDDPLDPLCSSCRSRVASEGDSMPVAWRMRDRRYVEKLATPDVTIADMVGDIDPIKAARAGLQLGDEMTMHYGLLPRANRGIFAINELPDLASKVQVGLFNVLQEGDVQIKGYPVRLRLDLVAVFSANPEDYTARGKIITPLKDRIGSEIRTHYPRTRQAAMAITSQEAWIDRGEATGVKLPIKVPAFVREVVEEIAIQARMDQKVDKRSGVSQRLPITTIENVVSNAERRALLAKEPMAVPRVSDIYAALPSVTGKIELEYEGELKGAEEVGRDLVRAAIATVFDGYSAQVDTRPVIAWFERGGEVELSDTAPAAALLASVDGVEGLDAVVKAVGANPRDPEPVRAATADFVLEGLCALKKISRTDDGRLRAQAPAGARKRDAQRELEQLMQDDEVVKSKKKYYN